MMNVLYGSKVLGVKPCSYPETTERRHAAVLNMYSDKKVEELMDKMLEYLKDHPIYELMELVASAIATVEQK